MGYWDEGHMDDGWGLAMVLAMLAVGLLIALAVGVAVLWTTRFASAPSQTSIGPLGGSATHGDPADAEQILAARMARGEIDTEEYRARLDVLRTADPR